MAQAFDALDFFQANQLQERNALRSLENSRQILQAGRDRLEESELQLMLKKKAASDLRKRLANLYSISATASQLDLLSSHVSLMNTVERRTAEKIAQVEETYCGNENSTSGNEFEANEMKIQKVIAAKNAISSLSKGLTAKSEEFVSKRDKNIELEASIVPLHEHLAALKLEADVLLQEHKETSSHIKVLEREVVALEEEREKVQQTRLQAEKSKMENQAQVKKEALDSEMQAKKASLAELKTCQFQKTLGLEERKKEHNEVHRMLTSLGVEMADLENRSLIDYQVLSKRVEELRIRLNHLRESSVSEEECWNHRKAEQETKFLKECAATIEPKREAVMALKRTLREKEESFTRMVKDYAAQYDALC